MQEKLKVARKVRIKKPDHSGMVRAYRFPLLVTQKQSDKLFSVTALCWEIRNTLVVERESNRLENRALKTENPDQPLHYLSRADQYVRVAHIARSDSRFSILHSQVLQNIAERISEGTKRWLSSLRKNKNKNKEESNSKIRPPHVIQRKEVCSFTYPQYGSAAHIKNGFLHLSKIGQIRVLDYRKMRGSPKSVTIRFDHGRWWASVSCVIQEKDVFQFRSAAAVSDLPDIGGDPGLSSLLTLSDGTVFDPPKALKNALLALQYAQRDLSRLFKVRKQLYAKEALKRSAADKLNKLDKLNESDRENKENKENQKNNENKVQPLSLRETPYSNRLKRQLCKVAKIHTKISRIREYHHRKIACQLEDCYRLVAIEEHGIQFMLKNRKIARAAADRGIAAFKQIVKNKLGMRYVATANQRKGIGGNSQTCICNAPVPKKLSDRIHHCPQCGLVDSRDVVSANIVELIAFGDCFLFLSRKKNKENKVNKEKVNKEKVNIEQPNSEWAGQALRRGETKIRADHSVMDESVVMRFLKQQTSEVSMKRPPHASHEHKRNTLGAEATREVDTL
jgi:transposase